MKHEKSRYKIKKIILLIKDIKLLFIIAIGVYKKLNVFLENSVFCKIQFQTCPLKVNYPETSTKNKLCFMFITNLRYMHLPAYF